MTGARILVVEDDRNLLDMLVYNLRREGYEPITAVDGAQGLEAARREKPDLIILDVMLPVMNGFEVCRILRREMSVPVMMLTAKADETDKIAGFDMGADDYVTKPFSLRELLARVRSMLRRAGMEKGPSTIGEVLLNIGHVEIDTARHRITRNGNELQLTPKEFDLLVFLARNRGFVFSRDQLLEKVWGYDFPGDTRTVDVHVRWLREKIEDNPNEPRHLLTVRGVGYRLEG